MRRLQDGVVEGRVAQHLTGRGSPRLIPRRDLDAGMMMPSLVVVPTRLPAVVMTWAMRRVVVVLPFVPVTATIGTRTG